MTLTRRSLLRGFAGAAIAAPLAALPLPATDTARLDELDDEADDLRATLETRREHLRWLLEQGDLADKTPINVAEDIVANVESDLWETGVFDGRPDSFEYARRLLTHLYGRRAAGLPAWPEDTRTLFRGVLMFVDGVLER